MQGADSFVKFCQYLSLLFAVPGDLVCWPKEERRLKGVIISCLLMSSSDQRLLTVSLIIIIAKKDKYCV